MWCSSSAIYSDTAISTPATSIIQHWLPQCLSSSLSWFSSYTIPSMSLILSLNIFSTCKIIIALLWTEYSRIECYCYQPEINLKMMMNMLVMMLILMIIIAMIMMMAGMMMLMYVTSIIQLRLPHCLPPTSSKRGTWVETILKSPTF